MYALVLVGLSVIEMLRPRERLARPCAWLTLACPGSAGGGGDPSRAGAVGARAEPSHPGAEEDTQRGQLAVRTRLTHS